MCFPSQNMVDYKVLQLYLSLLLRYLYFVVQVTSGDSWLQEVV